MKLFILPTEIKRPCPKLSSPSIDQVAWEVIKAPGLGRAKVSFHAEGSGFKLDKLYSNASLDAGVRKVIHKGCTRVIECLVEERWLSLADGAAESG